MKINWAPLKIPLERRLQTLAVAFQMNLLLFGELFCWILIVCLLVKGNLLVQMVTIAYLAFVYYDREVGDNGGRGSGSQWVRSWIIWKYFIDYFPIELIKTTDLSPAKNYLFAIFPHGVLSTGAFGNFNTNYSKWKELFPRIRPKLLTLGMHFNVPIYREIVLGWGMASASANSIKSILNMSNNPNDMANRDGCTSSAAVIVIGGAKEAFHSRPNNYTIVLKNRKGFIRLALSTGAELVPVLSFGEVDLFNQVAHPPESRLRKFQERFKSVTGIAPIFFNGRGIFQYNYGLIPQRKKITTVIGAPIPVIKSSKPTQQEIDELHARFCAELNDLFETNKSKYIANSEKIHLIIQ